MPLSGLYYLDVYARNAYLMFGGMEKGNSIKMGGQRDSGKEVRKHSFHFLEFLHNKLERLSPKNLYNLV